MIKAFTLFFCSLFLILPGFTQTIDEDDIIFAALQDELERNMTQLQFKDFPKPFFMAFSLSQSETLFIRATLGGIIYSRPHRQNHWYTRLMIGDYQLNDENFHHMSAQPPGFSGNIQIPLEADYWAIRRAFWMATNNVYKSATANYQNKITALKQKGIHPDSLEIPDFSQAPVIKRNLSPSHSLPDLSQLEKLARELSLVFKQYPDITDSQVDIYFNQNKVYFVNSEGTRVTYPVHIKVIHVSAQLQAENGEIFSENIKYYWQDQKNQPPADSLIQDAHRLAGYLQQLKDAEAFDQSYFGPALLMDQASAKFFSDVLFSDDLNLISRRQPLFNNHQVTMYMDRNVNATEGKIGKSVTLPAISIYDMPGLRHFGKTPLIGSYQIDAEGVVPPDSLILVEKGELQNLYANRIPTEKVRQSNGHFRPLISHYEWARQTGPGVMMIRHNPPEDSAVSDLKALLIRKARQQNLDFAILIKPLSLSGYASEKPIGSYIIGVDDPAPALVRSTELQSYAKNALSKIGGLSQQYYVYNTIFAPWNDFRVVSRRRSGLQLNGVAASFIVPDQLLLEEIELEGIPTPISVNKPVVPNPVKTNP
ncbi:MAG: metallopeptidase TldD-related protein [Candidatus Cyclobacteriaceae bacterium M3_2C_046]